MNQLPGFRFNKAEDEVVEIIPIVQERKEDEAVEDRASETMRSLLNKSECFSRAPVHFPRCYCDVVFHT